MDVRVAVAVASINSNENHGGNAQVRRSDFVGA